MPQTRRDFMKRTLGQAHNHLESAAEDIITLEQQFRPAHPDLADLLGLMLTGIDTIMGLMDTFADRAWGYHPDNYNVWRQSGDKGLKSAKYEKGVTRDNG